MIKSKKSQGGLELNWGVIAIGAVVLLVIFVLAYMYFNGKFTGVTSLLPGDEALMISSCKSDTGLLADQYCIYQLKNIEGKNQYVNCPFMFTVSERLHGVGNASFDNLPCGLTPAQECAQLASTMAAGKTFDNNTIVNGQACKIWIGNCRPKYPTTAEQCAAISTNANGECAGTATISSTNQCAWDPNNNKCSLYSACSGYTDKASCEADAFKLCLWG